MILLFPTHDTLRLALTSSIVSTDVTLTPASITFDSQGKIYLETATALSRTTIKNLDKIGVKGSKRHATDHPEEVSCWPQILPMSREAGTPNVSNQAPILFELSDADDLPSLVAEMLRLGNDRQGFRWFAEPNEDDPKRVLLRVIGPPYYTLLRALDKTTAGTKGTIRAYLERSPRVWIELGYTHVLADQIRVSEKQLLLLRSPREWVYLEEAPFQDVYDFLHFKLPLAPTGWRETEEIEKMSVPMRLTAGNAADVPELWVLRDNALEQLDTLVRDSDERLTQRLKFAVATDSEGTRTVILRTIPSKLPPPALPLENVLGFKPFWKLPNLFIPVGRRLHPTLRRDAVRKLLANDPDQVVWLYPGESGAFTPEFVPDGAFRSLEDWVSYIIELEQNPLEAWIEATRFDFDHFVCKDGPPKTKPDKPDKIKDETNDSLIPRGVAPLAKGTSKGKPPTPLKNSAADLLPALEPTASPSEWVKKRKELEEEFKAIEGSLDAPERWKLWPKLAVANAGAGNAKTEAAICWLNAMWGVDPVPTEWLAGWLKSEDNSFKDSIKADEFDKRLAKEGPSAEETRITVASFLWLTSLKPIPPWLVSRLPFVQHYLENNEREIPVRAVWLTGYRLAQLAGADVLGLARVRDRLLQRLLEQGLTAERDLPLFLRIAGLEDHERLRMVNEKAMELHTAVKKWTDSYPVNFPYIDLLFAFALAKLGETTKAKKLVEEARKVLEVPLPSVKKDDKLDEVAVLAICKNFFFKAFKYRIDQVLAGKQPTGQLSSDLINELDEITKKARSQGTNNPYKMSTFVIGRLREQSRILEPYEKIHPYSETTQGVDQVNKEFVELQAIRDPAKLADQIRKLLKIGVPGRPLKEAQFLILHKTLQLSSRVGESFAVELLQQVPSALTYTSPAGTPESVDLPKNQGELLESALFMAGHFDRSDIVKKLLDEFSELIRKKPESTRFKLINTVAGQCLRSLKKLGMRDEIDRFLHKLRNEVIGAGTLADAKKKYSSNPSVWYEYLQTLQNLAAGWLLYDMPEQAKPLLDEARNELLESRSTNASPHIYSELTRYYVGLARAYVTACGHYSSDVGIARITELFTKMDKTRVTNTWTTAPIFSRFHLNLVEDVIQAIVSEDFALSPSGRRWLDDDEYLVRRRIHADMKREREKSGL